MLATDFPHLYGRRYLCRPGYESELLNCSLARDSTVHGVPGKEFFDALCASMGMRVDGRLAIGLYVGRSEISC